MAESWEGGGLEGDHRRLTPLMTIGLIYLSPASPARRAVQRVGVTTTFYNCHLWREGRVKTSFGVETTRLVNLGLKSNTGRIHGAASHATRPCAGTYRKLGQPAGRVRPPETGRKAGMTTSEDGGENGAGGGVVEDNMRGLFDLPEDGQVSSLALTPDGCYVFAAFGGGEIRLYAQALRTVGAASRSGTIVAQIKSKVSSSRGERRSVPLAGRVSVLLARRV